MKIMVISWEMNGDFMIMNDNLNVEISIHLLLRRFFLAFVGEDSWKSHIRIHGD